MRFYIALLCAFAPAIAWAQAPANRFTSTISTRINVKPNEAAKRVDIEIDGKPFTSYVYDNTVKKPVLYPIMSPKQNFITRGWPLAPRPGERIDHPHHVGMWMNYANVNGVDFWNNSDNIDKEHKGPFGTIRHKAIKTVSSGKNLGVLETEAEWVGPNGKVLLNELTRYEFSGAGLDRQIDRKTTLTAVNGDVVFVDDKDGLLGIRVCRQLEHVYKTPEILTGADGKPAAQPVANYTGVTGMYTNGESLKGDSVWGKRAEFLLLHGNVNGEPITIAFLDNPENPGYPTYWHARGYGLMAANPLGQKIFSQDREEMNLKIKQGSSVTFRYLVRIQSGKPIEEDDAERLAAQWVKPDKDE